MGRNKKKTEISDVELLIWMLQKEWSCSKEAVWRVEFPRSILKACNEEIEGMTRYLQCLHEIDEKTAEIFLEGEEFPLSSALIVTKDAYVLIRVAKKLLTAAKESADGKRLVLALDDEEYRLVASKFMEYL